MSKAIMLVGLPASGKGAYAIELSNLENAIILSSDSMREELYGDVNHQDDNGELFQTLYKRAKDILNSGTNVIIDATNISSKRRIAFVSDFKKYELECHYLDTPFQICLQRDNERERTVGFHVIDRMYKGMQVPTIKEGWNRVKIIHRYSSEPVRSLKQYLESVITENVSYRGMFYEEFNGLDIFEMISELPHDSSYHSLNVSRHTYYVWKYILDNYHAEDKLIMLWAALLHDTGKAYCKNFKDGSRYANFINHENVSAQLSCNFLSWIGYEDDFISKVVELVQLHMRLLSTENSEKGKQKLLNAVGVYTYNQLTILREADLAAH